MVRKGILATVAMAEFLAPSAAAACQCVLTRDPEARRAFIIEISKHLFAGRMLSVKKRRSDDSTTDPIIEARVRVLRQIKGTLPKEITVVSRGGDNGANCGFGGGLAQGWVSGVPVTLALNEAQVKNGKVFYGANSCTSGRFHIAPSD